jgi:hypothetical protein
VDDLRLLPEPDADGAFRWPDAKVGSFDGVRGDWFLDGDTASTGLGFVTPEDAACAAAGFGIGPSLLAAAHHRHPPTTDAEVMAWAVLAGDTAAAWELADAVQIDRARPEGTTTQAEQIAGYRSVLLLTLKTLNRVRHAMLPGLTAGLTPAAVLDLDGVLLEESAFIGSVLTRETACASGSANTSASPSPTPATGPSA